MYVVEVCMRNERRTVVGRYAFKSVQAAIRGRIEIMQIWIRGSKMKVLVSSVMSK